ncbi:APC family permease [Sulfoacidibacillus ferrooxidans]|uniref:L-methionine/branched-chain amino acid exporter YjeH n=1 Tax=Sulfoacidibacillus ferrooxidans TaxID=2005001 RepID=A0A9X1V7D7_9BACL|nr:amino acid permease [Sulfoacidibacillus ferrooxidans]MCI0182135.1 L-methionine/branched-chain amino acid exporter YjeH [Sulfoacidibacillus ferrooxidans]
MTQETPPTLRRSLTWVHGAAMTTGSVLGSGVLILPALTANIAGPAALIAWIIMSALSFPIALTFARLAVKIPHAGGITAYVRAALGTRMSRSLSWLFLGTFPIGVPIVALIGADYVGSVFALSHWQITILAASIMLISIALNFRGIELASWIQVMLVILIAILLVTAIAGASPHIHSANFHPFVIHGWWSVGTSAVMIFWCFVGWEAATNLTEEFRNPHRDVALGLIVASIVIAILYLALAIVTIGAKAYGDHLGLAPLSILVSIGFGRTAGIFTSVLALLITFGTVHTNIAAFSRMLYAQAREGEMPHLFVTLHKTYQTPTTALITMGILSEITILYYGLFSPNLSIMIQLISVMDMATYMLSMFSATRLLPRNTGQWYTAFIALLLCALIYLFSGWTMIYPPLLIGLGWILAKKRPSTTAETLLEHSECTID